MEIHRQRRFKNKIKNATKINKGEQMDKKELSKKRRKNAKLFSIYKMFSWDLLFFYSIEFLFYTITKGITASEVLIINGFYLMSKIIMQLPAVVINDAVGRKNCIVIGNVALVIYILILILGKGAISIIIANLFCAIGYDLKYLSETNLLYDSVSTRGGEGLYSKIDSKGGSLYYIFDGITALISGYLFINNNYLPMILCLVCIVISTVISLMFEDIYEKPKKKKISKTISNTLRDLKKTAKFILKSGRMKAIIIFQIVLYGTIKIIDTYRSDLLIDLGIPEEQYAVIIGILSIIGGIAVSQKRSIEKKYKNRTLTFISMSYLIGVIIVGVIASISKTNVIIPTVLLIFAIQKICSSIWFVLETKYIKNFTTEKNRSNIAFAYEIVGATSASIFSILGGILLDHTNIEYSFLIIGLISLALMVLTLDYMKTRIGLKPHQYDKKDISY